MLAAGQTERKRHLLLVIEICRPNAVAPTYPFLAEDFLHNDDKTYWGEIPGLQGVWGNHTTLEGCRRELREALSDWIALRLRLGLEIPMLS
ncbi:MAG: hypothetical protein SXA11_25510 [Cyanobacteriota bacterium]|nr:hypothetical protein [Cyanobacteriota bacterium]